MKKNQVKRQPVKGIKEARKNKVEVLEWQLHFKKLGELGGKLIIMQTA